MAMDGELRPPKSDSYMNLFEDEQDVPLGGSAHSLRNLLSSTGSIDGRESPMRTLAPDALYSPVGHAVTNNITSRLQGAAVRSNIDDRPFCSGKAEGNPSAMSGPSILGNDAKYPTVQALAPVGGQTALLNGRAVDRGSPTLPKCPASVRTVSPTHFAQCDAVVAAQTDRAEDDSSAAAGPVRMPMSFVKALELSDKLASADDRLLHQRRRGGAGAAGGSGASGLLQQHPTVPEGVNEDCGNPPAESGDIELRQFGSSYEIAV